jgi:hypothetical protein
MSDVKKYLSRSEREPKGFHIQSLLCWPISNYCVVQLQEISEDERQAELNRKKEIKAKFASAANTGIVLHKNVPFT